MKKTISDLESQIRNPCYFQILYKQPELIDRILFFLSAMSVNQVIVDEHDYAALDKHYDDINRLCLVSKDFYKRIINEKFQINLAEKKKNNVCAFYYTGNMQLFVKTLSGETRTLKVNKTDSVNHLKEVVQISEGIPPNQQRLIFHGKQLENNTTLEENNIDNDCATIHLMLRLGGD